MERVSTASKDGHWWWIGNMTTSKRRMRQGLFYFEGKLVYAHRMSMHLFRGFDLNSEDQINHKPECNKSLCVNPDHLYIRDQKENINDMLVACTHHEANKTHCPAGHEYTPENTRMYKGSRNCRKCHVISAIASRDRKNARLREQGNVQSVNIEGGPNVPHL